MKTFLIVFALVSLLGNQPYVNILAPNEGPLTTLEACDAARLSLEKDVKSAAEWNDKTMVLMTKCVEEPPKGQPT